MKEINILLLLLFLSVSVLAQDYHISFRGSGASSTVGIVTIENLTLGNSIILNGTEVLHLMGATTETIPEIGLDNALQIYPNPMTDKCTVNFVATSLDLATIELFDVTGKRICTAQSILTNGAHSYQVSNLQRGTYSIRISSKSYSYNGKLISKGSTGTEVKINYAGNETLPVSSMNLKSTCLEKIMQYNSGDRLKITGTSGIYTTVITDIPTQNKEITFPFIACTDADGNNYPVVQIGTQIWMAENLRTTKTQNGYPIPNVSNNSEWARLTTSGYCSYDNDINNSNTYGYLYNWYSVNDLITPLGWHIPSDEEWAILTEFLGGIYMAGGKLKETGTNHWSSLNKDSSSNETGFTALPGGGRSTSGSYAYLGSDGQWWSSTEYYQNGKSFAWYIGMSYNYQGIVRNYSSPKVGFSVRCIKDN